VLALRSAPGAHGLCTFRGEPPEGEWGEQVVATAEAYADGRCPAEEVAAARARVEAKLPNARLGAAYCGPSAHLTPEGYEMLAATVAPTGREAAEAAVGSVSHFCVGLADSGPLRGFNPEFRKPVREQTYALQADLLREVFGPLPYREPSVGADVLAWHDRTVPRLAATVYDERRFEALPLLADALLDAGCDDEELMAHCRAGGEHVRGCWAVDAVLAGGR
jgi:hypothetical protein